MSKGIVTDYPGICFICGRPSEAEHHLVFGTAGRELSEKDGLKVPVCNDCHNMGDILCRHKTMASASEIAAEGSRVNFFTIKARKCERWKI